MGNFSLTLIDSLDMLVVLGDITEFEAAVRRIIETGNKILTSDWLTQKNTHL